MKNNRPSLFKIEELEPRLELAEWGEEEEPKNNEGCTNDSCSNGTCTDEGCNSNHSCDPEEITSN